MSTLEVLVTELDFINDQTRQNLFSTLTELISLNVVPIINTNDAVTPPPTYEDRAPRTKQVRNTRYHFNNIVSSNALSFSFAALTFQIISLKDNDSLAAMLASEVRADLLVLMSDVDGIYTAPPSHDGASLLSMFTSNMLKDIQFGSKSKKGTGGMDSKVSNCEEKK